MAGKLQKIYDAIVEGAEEGLSGDVLFRFVIRECPKATSKKIVRASLLALSDPDMKDEGVLRVIYDLAIRHRLDPVSDDDVDSEETVEAPKIEPRMRLRKKKRAGSRRPADKKRLHDETPGRE